MPEWLGAVLALLTGGGLVAVLRTLLLRRAEHRKISAEAEAIETQSRIATETSEFSRINDLLDRYERRYAELEARQAELEKQIAALREELAELRPKARRVAELEAHVLALNAEMEHLRGELEKLASLRPR